MAAKTFSTIDALVKRMEKDINATLNSECAKTIIDNYRLEIDNTVYNAYTPTKYKRRKSSGGLKDYKNFKKTQGDMSIKIRNVAMSNPRYTNRIRQTAESIERGTGVMSKIGARPFTKKTAERLENNKNHIRALKTGLKSRGHFIINY